MPGKPVGYPSNRLPSMFALRSIVFIAALASAITSCSQPQAPPPPPPQEQPKTDPPPRKRLLPSERGEVSSISLSRLFELHQSGSVLIYDARPDVLYREGHIAGAISMPKASCNEVIRARESELKAAKASGKTIVVYCSGIFCADARTVARHLASAGYSSSTYAGGWDEWKSAGLPSE